MAGWLKSIFGGGEPPPASDAPAAKKSAPWIGVDLDGTLAQWTSWKGLSRIGAPVPAMQRRVMEWIAAGHTVKIVTARASVPGGAEPVKAWLAKQGFPDLEVTNAKDFDMLELWDDRAVQVITNTGKPVIHPSMNARPKAPLFAHEQAGETFELSRVREDHEGEAPNRKPEA